MASPTPDNPARSTTTTVHLKATYTSPSTATPQILSSTPLPFPATTATTISSSSSETSELDVATKTTYLRSLRSATIALQERINGELTARMEEDVRAAAAEAQARKDGEVSGGEKRKNNGKGSGDVDEVAEEENYGEEVAEDDDEV
ncbi:hypothetical protein F4777DRAFT_394441 [Nemania sp. FL0916]|nr:hypothetical protein F4777DRAFT_394441 [Nemania sp. FL0916]